jgi:hypothetical protein
MLMPRTPSPSLVIAALALAVALGGTAYAASLPKNSVGSPQVRPNSLTGADLKEATLKGVMLGSGNARAVSKTLPNGASFTPLLTIPKVGRIEADCGNSSAQLRFFNTGKAPATMWARRSGALGRFTADPNDSSIAVSVSGLDFADLMVQTSSPKRLTLVHVATSVNPFLNCLHTAVGASLSRP